MEMVREVVKEREERREEENLGCDKDTLDTLPAEEVWRGRRDGEEEASMEQIYTTL